MATVSSVGVLPPRPDGPTEGSAGAAGPECTGAAREQAFCARVVWVWLALRTLFWTVLISWTQPNGRPDKLEWICWGSQWQWGYHKHPPLPAWMADCFFRLAGGSIWGVTLGGYAVTGVALWAVWRLGREMVPARLALLAALCLDGVLFFTYEAADFNNQVVLLACWALAVLFFHRALDTGRLRWWLALGVAVGLGLLCKYSMVFLLAPMALLMLLNRQARRAWGRPGPYVAVLVAAGLFAPHVVWLVHNDFITLHYAGARAAAGAGLWSDRLTSPLYFMLQQTARLLPLFLILLPLVSWRRSARPAVPRERFDRTFLLTLVAGPVALLLLLSAGFGLRLVDIWGHPLWTFTGLLVVLTLAKGADPRAFRRALLCWGVIAASIVALTLAKDYSLVTPAQRTNFPGRRLADELEAVWASRHPGPLPVVAGDQWLVWNVNCYNPHRPTPYFVSEAGTFDPRSTPWTDDADLLRRGGVLLWFAGPHDDDLPAEYHKHFPNAEVLPALMLPYARGARPPDRLGVAVVSPGSQGPAADRAHSP